MQQSLEFLPNLLPLDISKRGKASIRCGVVHILHEGFVHNAGKPSNVPWVYFVMGVRTVVAIQLTFENCFSNVSTKIRVREIGARIAPMQSQMYAMYVMMHRCGKERCGVGL